MPEQPVFARALWGYDRQQVDDYVATLLSYLEEAAQRLERAEQPQQPWGLQDQPVRRATSPSA